ncbi:hypothetical protein T492DRAFT_1064134 [Pavlovales sp. CCMP2436]|nr:hypothetical protein T492DRAFT_1064134 [Pavlovales sp. CCMP2436]|mmetsp:Transcript_30539/g.76485  ORF Transcript_30539/g.76485 Transcript_30539/m.76485 type:complete len:571 (-) Transcript_30539:221-1933(-)
MAAPSPLSRVLANATNSAHASRTRSASKNMGEGEGPRSFTADGYPVPSKASPGARPRSASKKYSRGGTALDAHESFAAPPPPTPPVPAVGTATPEPIVRVSATGSRPRVSAVGAKARVSLLGATAHDAVGADDDEQSFDCSSLHASPLSLSLSTDDPDPVTPSCVPGWLAPPGRNSAVAKRRTTPGMPGGGKADDDARYLRSKLIALEGRCAEQGRELERLHAAKARAPQTQPQPQPAAGPHTLRLAALPAAAPRALPQLVDTSAQAGSRHPIFGRLLADLGYKRIYLASARSLIASVPIWCRQRPVEKAKVAEIRAAKRGDGFAFPGVLSLFEMVKPAGRVALALDYPQAFGIFDGQHRLCAIAGMLRHTVADEAEDGIDGGANLRVAVAADGPRVSRAATSKEGAAAEGAAAPSELLEDVEVLAEVYWTHSEAEVKQWYVELNKAEIVKEIDLPDQIAPHKKVIIDEAVELLRHKFPDMFKPSERCRPPHLHRDTLRNKLFNHDIVDAHLLDARALLGCLERVNAKLGERADASWPAPIRKALPKARAQGFFLGLNDYGWLESLYLSS